MKAVVGCILLLLVSCRHYYHLSIPVVGGSRLTGTAFYKTAAAFNWQQRDSFALKEILSGNIPSFLKKLVPVPVFIIDSATGKKLTATFYVTQDYLSVGTDNDWARIPLTPMAAQKIADLLNSNND